LEAIGGVAGLVAALASSSFLLAVAAGVHVRPTTSYVRELGARTQPGQWVLPGH